MCFAGEAGAEVRGDTGRAQGLQRAAAGRRGDDEMGDVRGAGHHAVGALRLKIVDDQCVAFVLFFSFLFFSFLFFSCCVVSVLVPIRCDRGEPVG